MITAADLTRLSNLDAKVLKGLLQCQEKITSSKFLGLTNGGEFCYHVVYHIKGETDSAKVFVRLNPTNGLASASMT